MMTKLTEQDVLYYYDGPLLLTLQDGDELWLANAIKHTDNGFIYRAARVSDSEVSALVNCTMSVRGAFIGKPSRKIQADSATFSFVSEDEITYPEADLPKSGVALRPGLNDLPDAMPEDPINFETEIPNL